METLQEWADRWRVPGLCRDQLMEILEGPAVVTPQPAAPGTEAQVQQDLRLAAPMLKCLLWRNNTGVLKDLQGVPVRYGLCNDSARVNAKVKSSDLVGIAPDGRFLAVECKAPGWTYRGGLREEAQLRFINLVTQRGGVGLFATGVEDLERGLG